MQKTLTFEKAESLQNAKSLHKNIVLFLPELAGFGLGWLERRKHVRTQASRNAYSR